MRNLIIFLRRYFNFFLFLLLEVICIVLVFQNNSFQRTAYINSANSISGKLYDKYNNVQYYFHLKATNDSLVAENTRLHNAIASSFDSITTTNGVKIDTIRKYSDDSTRKVISTEIRKYNYSAAKVVNNSLNKPMNYITIHRGSKQGIRPNMGVISSSGVVGVVRSVSDNYAVILSLLSKSNSVSISARLQHGKEMGSVHWDGDDPEYATLRDIPKSAVMHKGDTVVTSGFSALFPENIPIGYIVGYLRGDKSSTSRPVKLKLATNFYNLQYVYVIENLLKDEQQSLEDSTYKLIK
ncbi:rod shape-determining protein MreC [Chitinophaga jiangningensis]|uniref:Cell shape-determining protein MreC n=1 Tax=Chitinophaga jiangningensis TaxID=1419482 RepID=A0A1M6X265_9BACT|nr:rod shape-determining protein MreC [Chitinophaga jiangningensis]SHL00026.1 rod shape-determining protein MreC [Chitinophaga jiangningensis]